MEIYRIDGTGLTSPDIHAFVEKTKTPLLSLMCKAVNPFDEMRLCMKGGVDKPISRAYWKMLEILTIDGINNDFKNALCLTEAPGGFIQAIHQMYPECKITAASRPDIAFAPEIHNMCVDVFPEWNAMDVGAGIFKTGGYDLCTADGSCGQGGDKAALNFDLIKQECMIASKCLCTGGTLCVKLFHIDLNTQKFIQELCATFASMRLVKPRGSRPGTSEIYLLADGFMEGLSVPNVDRIFSLDSIRIIQEAQVNATMEEARTFASMVIVHSAKTKHPVSLKRLDEFLKLSREQ